MPNPTEIAIALKATNLEQVQAALATVRSDVQRTADASATASSKVAASAADVQAATTRVATGFQLAIGKLVEVGNQGTSSLSGIGGSAVQLAGLFMPGGILAGAVSGLTSTIVGMFVRSREEMQKTREKFEKELQAMAQNASFSQIMKAMEAMGRGQFNAKTMTMEPGAELLLKERDAIGTQLFREREAARARAGGEVGREMVDQKFERISAERYAAFNARKVLFNDELITVQQLIEKYERLKELYSKLNGAASSMTMPTVSVKAGGKEKALRDRFIPLAGDMFDDKRTLFGRSAGSAAGEVDEKLQGQIPWMDPYYAPGTDAKSMRNQNGEVSFLIGTTLKQIEDKANEAKQQAELLGGGIAQSFGNGIANAFATLASGGSIGAAFANLGNAILSGLGGMLQRLGEQLLLANTLIKQAMQALIGLDPISGIAAAVGLIALGGILQGLGGRTSSQASVPVGAGAGAVGSGGGTVIDRGTISGSLLASAGTGGPVAAGKSGDTFVFIASDDPSAQANLLRMVRRGEQRGL